jgi:hypothetical protein
MSALPEACTNCGAPRATGLAMCRFCRTPLVDNTQEQAVPCPSCGALCEWGSQKCALCQAWVVVECVFCHQLSPHHVSACLACGEAFAGAPERLAARERAAALQKGLEVASVAASVLGAVAATGILSGHHHGGGLVESILGDDDD